MRKPIKKTTTKSKTSKTKKANIPAKLADVLHEKPIQEALREDILSYSEYVIEDRAVPAYLDGLKPSQRRLLWTMYYKMGSRPEKNYIKSARVNGETMQFHPHGDAYQTLVNMVEGTPCPLVIGLGNWGGYSIYTEAGAMRYTECKLSDFTMAMYFDPRFKNAYPRVPNFDGSSEEPVYLPAQLPIVLAMQQSGIAVGVTTDLPAFSVQSLYKAVLLALEAPKYVVHPKKLAKILKLIAPYGGVPKATEDDMLQFIKTGVASINWSCTYEIKGDEIYITGFPPNWSFDGKTNAIRKIPEVSEVADISSGNDILVRVTFRKVAREAKDKAISKVISLLKSKTHYKTNVTERYYQKDELVDFSRAKFMASSVVELLARWTADRVNMEVLALEDEISDLNRLLAYQLLMRKAVDNIEIIFKILKTKGVDKVEVLAKKLKISKEDSQTIWQIQVGRLDKLSSDQIDKRIKELNTSLAVAKKRLKRPAQSVIQHLQENKKALLKPVAYETQPD